MANQSVMRPVRPTLPAQLSLETQATTFATLKLRVAKLQAKMDAIGLKWLDGIPMSIQSYEDAMGASEMYTSEWFEDSMYSHEIQQKIANALLDSTVNYPLVNRDTWSRIASRS